MAGNYGGDNRQRLKPSKFRAGMRHR